MDNVRVIGLSGTNGAGKDAVGELLAKEHNFLFVSVTELLRDEARRRGLPVTREVLRQISAEWRREHGLGVLVDRAFETFASAKGDYKGLVLASLRNPGEADRLHELGGMVVWVDAAPKTRYARIQANAANRNRSGEDNKTFEQFLAEESAEMHRQAEGDDATLNTMGVKERADKTIVNDSGDLKTLSHQITTVLNLT